MEQAIEVKKNKRNNSIDLLRFISSVMVIIIHAHPFENWNAPLYKFIWNMSQIAVPFFFAISGFFYFSYTMGNKEKQKNYFKHIIPTYILWSIVYAIIAFVRWGYANLGNFVKEVLLNFFASGTYYHLWFMPALIYTVLIYFMLAKFIDKKKLLIVAVIFAVVGTAYRCSGVAVDLKIGLLSKLVEHTIRAITYFSIGGALSYFADKKKMMVAAAIAGTVAIAGYIADAVIKDEKISTAVKYVRWDALIIILILGSLLFPMEEANRKNFEWMAPASRFSYYAHEGFLQLWRFLLPVFPLFLQPTLLFVFTLITTTGLSLLLYNRKKPAFIKYLFG